MKIFRYGLFVLVLACAALPSVPASAAQKSRATLNSDATSNLPDNTSGAITAAIVRNTIKDLADSSFNLTTDDVGDLTAIGSGGDIPFESSGRYAYSGNLQFTSAGGLSVGVGLNLLTGPYKVNGAAIACSDLSNAAATCSSAAESGVTFTDITTNNASTSKHGFLPKLDGVGANCFHGDGTFSACPAGGVGGVGTVTSVDVAGGSTGLTTSGGPVTGSGTITLGGKVGIGYGGTNLTAVPGSSGDVIFNSGGTYGAYSVTNNRKRIVLQFSAVNPVTGQQGTYGVASCTGVISAWNIVADAGTATIKVWKNASAAPTVSDNISTSGFSLSSGTKIRSTDVTDLSGTAVTAGDAFAASVTAVATATKLYFALEETCN